MSPRRLGGECQGAANTGVTPVSRSGVRAGGLCVCPHVAIAAWAGRYAQWGVQVDHGTQESLTLLHRLQTTRLRHTPRNTCEMGLAPSPDTQGPPAAVSVPCTMASSSSSVERQKLRNSSASCCSKLSNCSFSTLTRATKARNNGVERSRSPAATHRASSI